MDDTSRRAIAAAVELARSLGLRCDKLESLADGANVLVLLGPAPVVARVATTTALVRKPPEIWLRRDVEMARFLAEQGFPAVPPTTELPAGPHVRDGFAISFWRHVEHDRSYAVTAEETSDLLRELHQALRDYEGSLERLNPFFEIPGWLDESEALGALAADDIAMLRKAHEKIALEIAAQDSFEQVLHGDAHRKNLLKTDRGLLWTDFEDCCRGPVLWDVACFARAAGEGRGVAISAWDLKGQEERLEPFFEARDLQGVVWLAVLATRFADRRERSGEWLAAARSRYGRL